MTGTGDSGTGKNRHGFCPQGDYVLVGERDGNK